MNNQSILSIYYPFVDVNQFHTAAYVYSKFKYLNKNEIIRIIENITKKILSYDEFVFFTNKIELNLQRIFPSDFFQNISNIDREISKFTSSNNVSNSPFRISFEKCYACKSQLSNEKIQTFVACVYFASNTTLECNNINVLCTKCKAHHFYSYWIDNKNQKFFYKDCLKKEFVSFSSRTIFEVKLLNTLTSDLMYKHTSFSAFCDSHNCNFKNKNLERSELNPQLLRDSWFYFQFFKYRNEYPDLHHLVYPNVEDIDYVLEVIRPGLFKNFALKWSSKHICKSKDCSKILNVDGNWKLNRLKCMNEDAYLECEELKPIKIGCVKTPNRGSYYCSNHQINEPILHFNVDSIKTKFALSSIKATHIQKDFKIKKIHDVYCVKKNEHDGKDDDENENNVDVLYLVDTSESRKPLCWVTRDCLDKKMLEIFCENQLKDTEKDAFDEITCKTNKHFGIPFENKKRTRGLLISSYNCGIVNGYRELFGSESVRQVVLFYLDLIQKVGNLPGKLIILTLTLIDN
jgi:hypothetical protein